VNEEAELSVTVFDWKGIDEMDGICTGSANSFSAFLTINKNTRICLLFTTFEKPPRLIAHHINA